MNIKNLIIYGTSTILIVLFLFTPHVYAADWNMFQHDSAHTGATNEIVEPPLELVWKSNTGPGGSLSVVGNSVFTKDHMGNLYAVDAKTGVIKWKYSTEGRIAASSPVVSENTVYTGTDKYLYAINATTGYFKWKYATGDMTGTATVFKDSVYFGEAKSSPAVVDGILYVGGSDYF